MSERLFQISWHKNANSSFNQNVICQIQFQFWKCNVYNIILPTPALKMFLKRLLISEVHETQSKLQHNKTLICFHWGPKKKKKALNIEKAGFFFFLNLNLNLRKNATVSLFGCSSSNTHTLFTPHSYMSNGKKHIIKKLQSLNCQRTQAVFLPPAIFFSSCCLAMILPSLYPERLRWWSILR